MKLWAAIAGVVIWLLGLLGRADRIREEREAEKAAEKTVADTRIDVHTMPDDQLDRETDRWTKG